MVAKPREALLTVYVGSHCGTPKRPCRRLREAGEPTVIAAAGSFYQLVQYSIAFLAAASLSDVSGGKAPNNRNNSAAAYVSIRTPFFPGLSAPRPQTLLSKLVSLLPALYSPSE